MQDFGRLRDVKNDEVELMRTWRNEPRVRMNMYTRHEISPPEHEAWWMKTSSRADQKYFIYECSEIPLGVVAFTAIDRINSNCSWAFYASPTAPKGTGSSMEFLALNYAFEELDMHKLCCEVLAFNKPVISMHEKFGFKVEGILRDQHYVDGRYVDIYRLGLLENEWAQQRPTIQEKLESFLKAKS